MALSPKHKDALQNDTTKLPPGVEVSKLPSKACVDLIMKGHRLSKVHKRGSTHKSLFKLDNSQRFIEYTQPGLCIFGDAEIQKVFVVNIQDIHVLPTSDIFCKNFKKLRGVSEDQCFSIVFGDDYKTLDLVAPDKAIKEVWVKALKQLLKSFNEADLVTKEEMWLKEIFSRSDKNGDGGLTLKEITSLLHQLSVEIDYEGVKRMFDEANASKNMDKHRAENLDFEEFRQFYQGITKRPGLGKIFEEYSNGDSYMDYSELAYFLKVEQQDVRSLDECKRIIQEVETCPAIKEENKMSFNSFKIMVNSPLMDIFNSEHSRIYQDMGQPLSHYFIDSSHNTYLLADQLVGPSSVEAYVRVLKRGCRCVELDCWDGENNEPVIYHGHTLTSKILAKDVLATLNLYAFEMSEYPLILSLENHMSLEQQKILVNHMRTIFGSKLHNTPIPDERGCLPSPEALKYKILVKNKKLKAAERLQMNEGGDVSDEDEASELKDVELAQELAMQIKRRASVAAKKKSQSLAAELSDCVVVCQSTTFKGFEKKYHFLENCSFGERDAFRLIETSHPEWIRHNMTHLSRIYPAGLRTDSSNYQPMPMWLCGNQLVALNHQTSDNPMLIYKGLFLDNGACGYVLKPEFLRNDHELFDPHGPFPEHWMKILSITVISGYQLAKKKKKNEIKLYDDIIDPYVEVEIVGASVDNVVLKTEHVVNNGFNPVWEKTLDFLIRVPQIALVFFRVMDFEDFRNDVMVAQYCLPFRCLKPGYRTIRLLNKQGESIRGASLLVKISLLH